MAPAYRWPGLEGASALVTGATGGIGAACAALLAGSGARVAVTFHERPPDATVAAVRRAGSEALPIRLDALDPASVDAAMARVRAWLGGPLHVLVNNAGSLHRRAPLEETTDAIWQEIIELNLGSMFRVTRAAAPLMTAGWGRIVSVSSLSAHDGGGPGAAPYAAAKAGVEGLTRALAKELAPRGITVNAVAPGYVAGTAQVAPFVSADEHTMLAEATLVGRAGTPEDVAAAIVHLASAAGGYISGSVLHVNGGRYLP
jgi:3-oxoacyl-[acyl-carrier protein] reductase